MRNWEGICRFIHQCHVSFCLGAGQPYKAEPTEEELRSIRVGVEFLIAKPEAPLRAQHDLWMETRKADGWVYGPVKDAETKTHPDLVDYEELPAVERAKDLNFQMSARAALAVFPEDV